MKVPDTVVLFSGSVSENKLADELKVVVSELYMIGDFAKPRHAMDATVQAANVSGRI